jgi:hypothetical protein
MKVFVKLIDCIISVIVLVVAICAFVLLITDC